MSIAVESPPAQKKAKRTAAAAGLAPPLDRPAPAGRGAPPPGLAGPMPGLGGPGVAVVQPQLSANPQMYQTGAYGRGVPPAANYGRGMGPPPPASYPPGVPPMGVPPQGRGMVSLSGSQKEPCSTLDFRD